MKITDEMLRQAAPKACDLWLATLPDDLPEHIFSARFEQKMEKLLRHLYRYRRMRSLLIAAVAAALLTMTVGATVLPPIRAFRSGVVDVLSQLLPKSTDQIYTTDADHEGATRRPVLGWLPEGMVETKRSEQPEYTHLNFNMSNENFITVFVQRIFNNSSPSTSIDTEDAHTETIFINGNPALISIKEETTIIEWCIDNYICSVIGTIPTEEVLKVAENIELK